MMGPKSVQPAVDSIADVMHGDDLHNFPGLVKANFSSNVWPNGVSDGMERAVMESLAGMGSYPPPHAETVRERLAAKLNCSSSSIVALNGAIEGIYLIAQAFNGSTSHVVVPTFGEYERACLLNGHQLCTVDDAWFANATVLPKGLWWICNPNNPTGTVFSIDRLRQLMEANPECTFVVDEAYVSLSPAGELLLPYIHWHSNLLILCSLTKSYAMPGIRAGYLVGNPQLVKRISAYQPPWSVGVTALAAIGYSVDHAPFDTQELQAYLYQSQLLQNRIGAIDGFVVKPSPLGFFLVNTPFNASKLKQFLMDGYGILVRDASLFKSLGNSYIRVATQCAEHNDMLVRALSESLYPLPPNHE